MPEHRFTFRRRVEFADTDLAGIMHFSNFFRFMEVAEHAFYRSLGFTVHPLRHGGANPEHPRVGWPRVHASADYRLPLEFEEEVEIELLVEEVRQKVIKYFFRFWKLPDGDRLLAATGRFTVVCVTFDETTQRMKATPVPPVFLDRIVPSPAEVLREATQGGHPG